MTNQNEPNRYSSSTPRRSTRARSNVYNARDELENERRLYSHHDPNTSLMHERVQGGNANQGRSASNAGSWQQGADGSWHHTIGQQPAASQRQAAPGQRQAVPGARPQRSAAAGQRPNTARSVPNMGASGNPTPMKSAASYSRENYRRAQQAARSSANASNYSAARYQNRRRSAGTNSVAVGRKRAGFFTPQVLGVLAVLVVLVVVGIFGFNNWMETKEVQVTLNGDEVTISGNQRSIEGVLDNNLVTVSAGNYVAVDGSTLREGQGTRCTAKVNGNDVTDMNTHLYGGDKIEISNGTDITEGYTDSNPQTLSFETEVKGYGAVHLYTSKGEDGEKVTRTGNESGITCDITTKEPQNCVVQCYNVDAGNDKVIALTFDDGPWDTTTTEILDILKENDAKATFFTVGQCISGHEDLIKREVEDGHQVCTHTYDHAEGSGQGVSLILMSSDERRQEITKGYEAIEAVTGGTASTIVRCPGGNYDQSVANDLKDLVTAEIGWNVDTMDWSRPGASSIESAIESVKGGYIVLMHDGGGDRSQTVEGLRQALPKLKAEGYTFVTVQELIEKYPYSGDDSSNA